MLKWFPDLSRNPKVQDEMLPCPFALALSLLELSYLADTGKKGLFVLMISRKIIVG